MMRTGVRWSLASPLSDRQMEERMEEPGVPVDHATIPRGVLHESRSLEAACHRRQRPVGGRGQMDERSTNVTGPWDDLSRAVDQAGHPSDSLVTEPRDARAATPFLTQTIRPHGMPDTITMDRHEAHAAIRSDHQAHGTTILIRQVTSWHHAVEPDHRGSKRLTRPLRGFTSCQVAQGTQVGFERMLRRKTGHMAVEAGAEGLTPVEPFSTRAASSPDQEA
jgi:transposase-like protein